MLLNTQTVHLPAEHTLVVTSTDFASVEVLRIGGSIREVNTILPNRIIKVGPFSCPREYLLSSDQPNFSYSFEEEKLAYNHEGTGIFDGGQVTINADITKIDIAAGTGIIVDNYTDPEIPRVIHITWPDLIGIDVEFLLTEFGSFVGINGAGEIVFFSASDPDIDKRDNVFLGILGHIFTVVDSIASAPTPGYDQTHMIIDLADSIGIINVSGNVYNSNGANLKVNKTIGESFSIGYNHRNSAKEPNVITDPAATAPLFVPGFRDGSGGFSIATPTADVDVANYDNGTGTLVAVPASDPWQIFRMYYFPSIDNHALIYGQNLYKTKASAEASIFGEVYDEAPELAAGILRSYILTKRDATDLGDTNTAKFIAANNFGSTPAGGITTSTTTLQQAYNNSEIDAEILTNTTQGPLCLREGAGVDSNMIFQLQNNSGTVVFETDGRGRIKGATHGDTTANRPASPLTFEFFFDTTLGIPIWYDGTNWVDATGATV